MDLGNREPPPIPGAMSDSEDMDAATKELVMGCRNQWMPQVDAATNGCRNQRMSDSEAMGGQISSRSARSASAIELTVGFEDGSVAKASGTVDANKDLDRASTVVDDDFSKEQLQMIKARTMFQMVEEIESTTAGGQPRKLLFLTNQQAEFIASSTGSIQKMIDALEMPKPKLIINMLTSQGFRPFTKSFDKLSQASTDAGVVHGRAPFCSYEEEKQSCELIDRFMSDVIIPLAAQTNAIIICSGTDCNCILGSSLTRIYGAVRAQWGQKAPFTILSCTPNVAAMYCNPDEQANWRHVRRSSRTWKQRHYKIQELIYSQRADADGNLPYRSHDLDPQAMCYIIVDGISKREKVNDRTAYNRLMGEMMRYLCSTLPSLAIKTGNADKVTLQRATTAASSLGVAVEAMLSGSPLLFLDTRPRPPIEAKWRSDLIQAAKEAYNEHCEKLLGCNPMVAETFDAMSIAYFHEVLNGMVPASSAKTAQRPNEAKSPHLGLPLHEAIRRSRDDHRSDFGDDVNQMAPASAAEVSETASWLADRFFRDAWNVLPDRAEREARDESYVDLYESRIDAMSIFIRTLLASASFHHINLHDIGAGQRLVNHLVKLDRLPKESPLEGLELMSEAWVEYDVAMKLAGRYKVSCKLLFALQLLVTWLVIAFSTVQGQEMVEVEMEIEFNMSDVVFILAVFGTLLLALETLLNSQNRWRQLRSSAGSLESIIYQYRTRVGYFELDTTQPMSQRPEAELRNALNEWRDDLVAGADLAVTNLAKEHPASVYRHFQFSGSPTTEEDDFHSPMQPYRYIALRIEPSVSFFKRRIPMYTRRRLFMKVFVIILGVISSMLARWEQVSAVTIVSTLGSISTSWSEFSNAGRKVERYTRAITSMKKLLSWWKSLSEVERAATENISMLIQTSESIISQERLAWVSTASKKREEEGTANTGSEATQKDSADAAPVHQKV